MFQDIFFIWLSALMCIFIRSPWLIFGTCEAEKGSWGGLPRWFGFCVICSLVVFENQMVMDYSNRVYRVQGNALEVNNQSVLALPDLNPGSSLSGCDGFLNGNSNTLPVSCHRNVNNGNRLCDGDSTEDIDFSDTVLKYINHILMEEDVEEKFCMFQESAALQAAEKSFYEALGEKNPVSASHQQVPVVDRSVENPDAGFFDERRKCSCSRDREIFCADWNSDPKKSVFYENCVPANLTSRATSYLSYSSSSSGDTCIDGPTESPESIHSIADLFSDNRSAMQFKKGFEEGSKFLCDSGNNLVVDSTCDELSRNMWKQGSSSLVVKVEKSLQIAESIQESRGKNYSYRGRNELDEGRTTKQSAIYTESTVSSEMFDKVLLCSNGKSDSDLRKALNEVSKISPMNDPPKGSHGRKNHGKKQGGKKSVVDMRTLLTLCAQAVAADDRRAAYEFLKQIRQHASPTGDGMQRLAHYFSDGLEARLAGSGTRIYKSVINLPASAADFLKAYHIYLATCPFRKISNFFANKTIINVANKVTRLHIIDFGILYGFQWPCFLQRLSSTPGGPPKIRITGIDLPCPGFRPSQRVEETGKRLERYARIFNVPFEFNAIAQKWETIKLEDLKIRKDEMLVVNSFFRLKNLLDETVMVNSPRDIVLNLIKEMNPAVFIQGVMNGAYNAPFFITRFREALFHFSSLFDMLDANIPREIQERTLLERTVFGREAMNVIACEGAERIERPESYKQWQVRNMRAGFKQLPLNEEIKKLAEDRMKSGYHKDFVIVEDGQWMLLGWKGRIMYALSSWKPRL